MTTILITGAARGIGLALTQRAAARGDTVFATVRKDSDKAKFDRWPNVTPILMDVADTASVEHGFAELDRLLAGQPLQVVINAAAISIPGAIELAPIQEAEDTMNTNVVGSMRVLKAAIPRLRGHDGRIVLITSLWGRASSAMIASYCASKHAIESIADSARRETSGMGLHVVLVEPGVIRTDMYEKQGEHVEQLIGQMSPAQHAVYGPIYRRYQKLVGGPKGDQTPNMGISAEACAAGIEKAAFAAKPKPRYRVGMDAKVVCLLADLLPARWMDVVMGQSLNNKPL
ncbi:MAG TPA: SDR family NAD(P)-dependent oxidoreductase [Macromonas sp.]|nr:SDR family NAD(P)-dependent oxidoreductase [Macromonas sp.]